jgi:hypothetical protein
MQFIKYTNASVAGVNYYRENVEGGQRAYRIDKDGTKWVLSLEHPTEPGQYDPPREELSRWATVKAAQTAAEGHALRLKEEAARKGPSYALAIVALNRKAEECRREADRKEAIAGDGRARTAEQARRLLDAIAQYRADAAEYEAAAKALASKEN